MCLQHIFALIFILFSSFAFAQSTWEKVYNIFQGSCTFSVCHDNTPALGIPDLQGTGPTLADSMQAVYNNIFNQIPSNVSAQSKGYKLIYPGDYYLSFLFRKINSGFVPDISLDAMEGCPMPKTGLCTELPIADSSIELIRQWIIFGAPDTGIVGIAEIGINSQFIRIFPNPFTSSTTLYINSPQLSGIRGVSFTLYDVFGKRIKQIDHIKSQQIVIQRGNLSSGVYFFKISVKNKVIGSGKLLIISP